MTTKLSDQEIKKLGYETQKKEDTFFMKKNTLDIEKIEKRGVASGSDQPSYYQYEGAINDEIYIKISGDIISGFSKKIRIKENHFETYYEYYPNGKIKEWGKLYSKEFAKGIWYWYDEAGNIEKYEDYDAPYEFGWEDVLKFLEKEEIKKEQIKEIHRSNSSGKYLWYIIFKPKEFLKTDDAKVYQLDGKTGEIFKTEVISTARHLD